MADVNSVSFAQAKARLGELLDEVEAGAEVAITRRGRIVAHLTPPQRGKAPLPLDDLASFRATMPQIPHSTAEALRAARDEER